MAIRETIQIGEPVLRTVAAAVTDVESESTQTLVDDLIDTMRAEELVGIAANQVGFAKRILVAEIRETKYRKMGTSPLYVCINPVIESVSPEQEKMYEGCGSVNNGQLFGEVERPKSTTISFTDRYGKKHTETFDGILARVILHEYDHLEGIMFTDIADPKTFVNKQYYLEHIRGIKTDS